MADMAGKEKQLCRRLSVRPPLTGWHTKKAAGFKHPSEALLIIPLAECLAAKGYNLHRSRHHGVQRW